VKKLVDAMCSTALQALHDFKQRERPSVFISHRCKQEVDVIRHHYCGKQINLFPVLSEDMFQNKIACYLGQDERAAPTEGYEQRRVTLEVRQAAILVLRCQNTDGHSQDFNSF
jgi:hypothetical protein